MRRLITLAVGLLCLASGHAVAQNEVDPTEVERFTDGDAEKGAKLYKRYCGGCHGEDGRGGAQTFMPHIQNLTQKDYIEFLPDGYLFTVIAEGGVAVGKSSYDAGVERGRCPSRTSRTSSPTSASLPTY